MRILLANEIVRHRVILKYTFIRFSSSLILSEEINSIKFDLVEMNIELSDYSFESNMIKLNKICVLNPYSHNVFVNFGKSYLVSF